jgi:hypothetical protein
MNAKEFADKWEWDINHNHPGWSFNKKCSEMRKVAAFRANVMKVAFNAQQFNRRAAFVRKTNCSAETAASMFPTSG